MRRIVVFVSALSLLMGCAGPMYHVTIDSISGLDINAKKRYILLPAVKGVDQNDLQFREFSAYVERALSSAGYIRVRKFEDADIAVFLAYGVGDPKDHLYSYSLPVWGQTGVSSSTTYGTITSYGSYGTFHGTTTYTPTYGITGYTTHVGSYTTFFRFIVLEAVDLEEYRRSEKIVQVWKTAVTSRGASSDLRRVFPVLIAAARPYIGTNTGKQVDLTLTEGHKHVLEIKGLAK